jgi:hypothetical protein
MSLSPLSRGPGASGERVRWKVVILRFFAGSVASRCLRSTIGAKSTLAMRTLLWNCGPPVYLQMLLHGMGTGLYTQSRA